MRSAISSIPGSLPSPVDTAPRVLLGLEHEFLCHDLSGRRVDFRTVIDGLDLGSKNLVPTDRRARWLSTGSLVTADKLEAEIATPPTELAAGFARTLDSWAAFEGARLSERVPALRLTGDSTHINVSLPDDVDPDDVADLFASRFAVGQMLLMDRRNSPGLLVRPRPHRLEIGGEYVVGAALRAALAYAAGATLACVQAVRTGIHDGLPPALLVRVERNVIRYGWYVARTAFGGDLYRHGREAWLAVVDGGLITAQDSMVGAWGVARNLVAAATGPADLADADSMVAGAIDLPIEAADKQEQQPATPVAPKSVYGDLLAPRTRPDYDMAPVMLTWELAVFLVADVGRRRSAFAAVPGPALAGFARALESGALDGVIVEYLRGRHPRRRLLGHEQTRTPGLFDELGLRISLLAPERDFWGRPMHLRLRRPLPRSFGRQVAA